MIDFAKIAYAQWMLIAGVVALAIYGLVQFSHPYLAERHFRDGYNFLMQQNFDVAISEFEQAIDYAPWETYYMVHLGKAYEGKGNTQTTAKEKLAYVEKEFQLTQHMVELEPFNPWYENRVGMLYLTLSELVPEKREAYIKLGQLHIEKAAKIDSQNPLFQMSLGFFYHRLGQLDKAQAIYEWVLGVDPNILEAQFNLGNLYQQRGMMDKALGCYEAIYKINPDWNNIRGLLGKWFYYQKNIERAQFYFEEDYHKNPLSVEAQRNLVSLYHAQGQWEKAMPVYEKLYVIYPNDQNIVLMYADALFRSGQRAKTREVLQGFVARNPQNDFMRSRLALVN